MFFLHNALILWCRSSTFPAVVTKTCRRSHAYWARNTALVSHWIKNGVYVLANRSNFVYLRACMAWSCTKSYLSFVLKSIPTWLCFKVVSQCSRAVPASCLVFRIPFEGWLITVSWNSSTFIVFPSVYYLSQLDCLFAVMCVCTKWSRAFNFFFGSLSNVVPVTVTVVFFDVVNSTGDMRICIILKAHCPLQKLVSEHQQVIRNTNYNYN